VKSDPNQWPPIVGGVQRSRAAVKRRFMDAQQQRSRDTWRAVQAATDQSTIAVVEIEHQRRRQSAAWLASQSPHQKRASEILNVFDIEVKNVTRSPLATFLLHYICCEALGKLLIVSRENVPPYMIFQRKTDGGLEIHLTKLKSSVHRLGVPLSDAALDTVFLSGMKTAGQRSCRVLRNAVAHELQSDHVAEVNHRIAELTKHMADFIEGVRVRSEAGHLF
jgi:hypothetical protein